MPSFPNRDFNNNEIRVFYPDYFPEVSRDCTRFPNLKVNPYCAYPGMMVEMLDAISKEAGLKIVPYITEQLCPQKSCGEHFTYPFLLNGTIDLSAGGKVKTDGRSEHFEFTEHLYSVRTNVIQQSKGNHYEQIFSFFLSYDSKVWMTLLAVWCIQWICCVLSQQLDSYSMGRKPLSIVDSAWQVLRLQLLQYRDLNYTPNASSKLSMSIFSFFQCYVLLGLFSCFILASSLKPHQILDDPLELLTKDLKVGKYKLVVRSDDNWFFEKLNHSKSYPFPEIHEALNENPHIVIKNEEMALRLAEKGEENILIFQQTDDLGYYIVRRHCNLVLLGAGMPLTSAHLMMAKGHPLFPRVDKAIKASRAKLAAIEHKYKLYTERFDKCAAKRTRFRALSIAPYLGSSMICAGLVFVAFIALFVEILVSKMQLKVDDSVENVWYMEKKK